MMTTNLSRAQPMAMPWNDDIYFFDPAEFEKLFGPVVVQAMIDHPPPLPSGPVGRRIREVLLVHAGTLRPFPRAADLPIIVATRMSLSFPLLISAVPLYALDYTGANLAYVKAVREWRQQHPDASLAEHAAAVAERPVFDVNWFSDGGLTANLPVQFFDSVLPSRPTFAIDLAPFSDDHPRSSRRAGQQLSASGQPGRRPPTYGSVGAQAPVGPVLLRSVAGGDRADLGRPGVADHAGLPRPGGDGLPGRCRGRHQPGHAARAGDGAESARTVRRRPAGRSVRSGRGAAGRTTGGSATARPPPR